MSTRAVGETQPQRLGRSAPRSISGSGRMRRVLVLAGCGMLGVGLSACESTEQESSRIGRENEAATRAATPKPAAKKHAGPRSHGRGHGSTHGTPEEGSSSP